MNSLLQRPKPDNMASDIQLTKDGGDCCTEIKESSENNNPQCNEPGFPFDIFAKFDAKLASSPSNVPVLLDGEFECLLDSIIHLCRYGAAAENEACQRFLCNSLKTAFTRNLSNKAVSSWEPQIHDKIHANCMKLVKLCAYNLFENISLSVLNLLAMVFDPNNEFHKFNAGKKSKTEQVESKMAEYLLYARSPPDPEQPYGWLVDLINRFGKHGGFFILQGKFLTNDRNSTVRLIHALFVPFQRCHQLLTVSAVVNHFAPIGQSFSKVTDELIGKLLKEDKYPEMKLIMNDIFAIIDVVESIISSLPDDLEEKIFTKWESLRLQMAVKFLQIPSLLGGRTNALNEIKKLPYSTDPAQEGKRWLATQRLAKWMKDNGNLEKILRDLPQEPRYVQKLEYILLFIVKELTLDDLDAVWVWAAQASENEAIIDNIHELLANLARNVSSEQLDHLFECFQRSWETANEKTCEKLLKLIQQLVQNDRDGVMAHKELTFLCNLGPSDGVSTTTSSGHSRFVKLITDFFEEHILQIDPALLTEGEFNCFKEAFIMVNIKEGKLERQSGGLLRHDLDLIGADYLWRVVYNSPEGIANRGIELLVTVNANAGSGLNLSGSAFQKIFLNDCRNCLKLHNDKLSRLIRESLLEEFTENRDKIAMEIQKLSRVARAMSEYASQCTGKEVKN